jgi:hypothetical protein
MDVSRIAALCEETDGLIKESRELIATTHLHLRLARKLSQKPQITKTKPKAPDALKDWLSSCAGELAAS